MKLCLMVEGQEGVSWEQWVNLAHACEEHGIVALFRSDHYMNLGGRHPERAALDAWGTLCGLAALTSTLRLGTLVSPATFRHPSNLAKLAVTADHISDGRIEVGLGAGWHEREHEAYGFPFPVTRVRMEVLEEQLQIVLGNWAEERFSFAGKHYRCSELEAQPKPVQQPHPPLIMGGLAGPRSAGLAAAYADEYNTTFPTVAQVGERIGRVQAACEKARRSHLPFSVMTCVIPGADQRDLEHRVRRVAERRGEEIDLADPPTGWIIGTREQVSEQLASLREAGVSRVMCQYLVHDDLEGVALLGDIARALPQGAGRGGG
ncbi:MAG: LLM class flavin-dependent oxidoreductase [Solirubrobacterales bacterium]|nr:LLM class flavin-dependent oxidoreductase [Solirubrobacterales bacterium]